MNFTYNDGGRAAAGFKGDAGDCLVRAIAIATGEDYSSIYDAINEIGKTDRLSKKRRQRGGKSSARTGVWKSTTRRYLASIGWKWTPTMGIGTGCTVHMRTEELPPGRIIVQLSRHVAAVIDGVVHDTYDPSREGTRCVYGYWSKG